MAEQKKDKQLKNKLKDFRSGAVASEHVVEEGDRNTLDVLNAGDTTAFPTYINDQNQVVSGGPRKVVGEKIPPEVSTDNSPSSNPQPLPNKK